MLFHSKELIPVHLPEAEMEDNGVCGQLSQ